MHMLRFSVMISQKGDTNATWAQDHFMKWQVDECFLDFLSYFVVHFQIVERLVICRS